MSEPQFNEHGAEISGRMLLTVGEETREIGPGDGWYAPGQFCGKSDADGPPPAHTQPATAPGLPPNSASC